MTQTGTRRHDSAAPMRYSLFSVQDHHPNLPRTVPKLYQEVMQQCIEAERLGFDTAFIAEHHFHEYGAVPNPAVYLAALAQRTTRLRLGPAIVVLPFRHPLEVAESYAMLDVLSNGRLTLGVGSGYLKHEFEGWGVPGEEKRERFDESLVLLKRALAGERITHHGRFFVCNEAALNVLPLQRPVPIYCAVLRREAARWIGRQGNNLMAMPYTACDELGQVGAIVEEYQAGWRESGAAGGGGMLFGFHAHVADTDAECRRVAEIPFNLYVDTRLYAKRQTYDDILRSGLGLFGSVARVVDKLIQLSEMGVDHVLFLQDFGAMPLADVLRSMRLMAEEVMPRVNRAIRGKQGLPQTA